MVRSAYKPLPAKPCVLSKVPMFEWRARPLDTPFKFEQTMKPRPPYHISKLTPSFGLQSPPWSVEQFSRSRCSRLWSSRTSYMETTKAARDLPVRASPTATPMEPNATEIAFLVQKYLKDENFSKTLSVFRKEAISALSSKVKVCPPSTCLKGVLSEYVRFCLENDVLTVKLREFEASNRTLQRKLQEAEASSSTLQHKLQEAEDNLGAIRGLLEPGTSQKRLPLKRKRIVAPKASELSAPAPVNWTAATPQAMISSGCALALAATRVGPYPGCFDVDSVFFPALNESSESSGPTDPGIFQRGRCDSSSPDPGPIEDILSLPCDDLNGMYDTLAISEDFFRRL